MHKSKDVGAQINIFASDHAQVAFHVGYLDANTVQNGAQRLMAPGLPAEMIERGVLLVLEQLRNNRTAKTGDRGYIQKLSEKAVKLRFMTPEAKMAIIDMPDNPEMLVLG